MSATERPTQDAILKALKQLPGVFAWRNNTGRRGGVAFGYPGSPDVLVVVAPHGRLLSLEVKADTGKQSDDQMEFEANVTRHGGHYAVVRSLDEALAAIALARR